MEDTQTVLYALFAVFAAVYLFRWRSDPVCTLTQAWTSSQTLIRFLQLSHIPTVGGPSAPILSYWSTVNFFRKPKALLREGYQRVRGRC